MTDLQAIGSHVFIKRHVTDAQVGGIDISEKAQVKSYLGEIASVSAGSCVKVGDTVHIPHIQVNDCVVRGEEFAVARHDDLFAKKVGDVFRPINKYVLVRKCVNDHIRDESGEIALYMTENNIETTNWVEVVDVADDCKKMRREYIGMFCVSPESDDRLQRILYSKDYCLHEDLIKFVTTGD